MRRVSRGKTSARFESLETFTAADPRRAEKYQVDFGVGWPDGEQLIGRVTWLKATGELIAASERGAGGGVEVMETITSEREVERRLKDWEYVGAGRRGGGLPWIRFRAHGWTVPLPPKAARWRLEEADPLKPWPSPPLATVGRDEGAYLGTKGNPRNSVEIVEPGRRARPLYHYVDSSPTGFAWGYGGAGPSDLARSVLADRLGYVPSGAVYADFRNEVVANLGESFTLTFAEVDDWIDRHVDLFAANPRAELFDPYAAGGAP